MKWWSQECHEKGSENSKGRIMGHKTLRESGSNPWEGNARASGAQGSWQLLNVTALGAPQQPIPRNKRKMMQGLDGPQTQRREKQQGPQSSGCTATSWRCEGAEQALVAWAKGWANPFVNAQEGGELRKAPACCSDEGIPCGLHFSLPLHPANWDD